MDAKVKREKRIKRHKRARAKISGIPLRPRLSVFRSNQHIYAQVIDDQSGRTIFSASSLGSGKTKRREKKLTLAKKVGEELAILAKKQNVKKVAFDRGAYKFHGRLKALAEGARAGGLEF
ncbi:MAG: 50S ribosomal protein L18 [Candidatus Doudnabacteria bacterium]|nr:50S ribosomal protein L18 [Candidatus Doudnabacteria bacterium]